MPSPAVSIPEKPTAPCAFRSDPIPVAKPLLRASSPRRRHAAGVTSRRGSARRYCRPAPSESRRIITVPCGGVGFSATVRHAQYLVRVHRPAVCRASRRRDRWAGSGDARPRPTPRRQWLIALRLRGSSGWSIIESALRERVPHCNMPARVAALLAVAPNTMRSPGGARGVGEMKLQRSG
jgi:hypothetical protein